MKHIREIITKHTRIAIGPLQLVHYLFARGKPIADDIAILAVTTSVSTQR